MDTKFSVAVHTLILLSEAPGTLNSDQIAMSVGTNGSYIRKILSLLRKAGIIKSHKGVSSYELTSKSEDISLLDIYKAVMEEEEIHLFDIHQNPNDMCIVGRHIKPVLGNMFKDLEDSFSQELANRTLSECIDDIRRRENNL